MELFCSSDVIIDISSTLPFYGALLALKKVSFMAQPHYVTETQVLRRVARNPQCRFRWTRHAIQAVIDDGRTTQDVEDMLTNGQVLLHEQKQDLLWRVRGSNVDGEKIEAVVAVFEETITIKVVTTF